MKTDKQAKLSRREFTTVTMIFLSGIMGAVMGFPLISYIISPAVKTRKIDDWVSIGALDSYPIGTPTLFTFTRITVNGWERTANNYGVYVLRTSVSQVKVFSNICTHLMCRLKWVDETQSFDCPCHDAKFDIDGAVIHGPPPRPMSQWSGEEIRMDEEGRLLIHFTGG